MVDNWRGRCYTSDTGKATKERTMLKLIGIGAVVYVGWITGIIQATLIIIAAGLTTIAGL